jgi:predicted metal-dependent enzyme (double-stranded beta helix superfamily)
MFTTDRLIADCRSALQEGSAQDAIKEIVMRAVSDAPAVALALGTPTRSGIVTLHQSPELTILNVIWAPGMTIYPHDHRMWAVIGVYEGREDNAFFKRTANGLVQASAKELEAGDTVLLGAPTVHAVTNRLGRFTGALQIYGGDFFKVPRSEFDPETLEERPFDIERAKRVFLDANEGISARE